MGISGQDADAAFFNLMHHYVTAPPTDEEGAAAADPRDEQRRRSRRAFRIKQRIAPGYCWEVPPAAAWIEVLCHDLTQGGFSYFLDEKPSYDRLVAMFRPAAPIFVAASINHCRPVLVDEWGGIMEPGASLAGASTLREPESRFLVGCQFLRRFSL